MSLSRWFGGSAVRGDELLGAVSNLPQPLFFHSLPLIPQADNILVESRNMGDKIGTLPCDMGPNMITQKTMLLFVQVLSNRLHACRVPEQPGRFQKVIWNSFYLIRERLLDFFQTVRKHMIRGADPQEAAD